MRNVHNAVDNLLEELDFDPLRRVVQQDPNNARRWMIKFRLNHVFGSFLIVEIMENNAGDAVGFVLAQNGFGRQLVEDIMNLLMDFLDDDDDDATTLTLESSETYEKED
jgi:hypothetical protein